MIRLAHGWHILLNIPRNVRVWSKSKIDFLYPDVGKELKMHWRLLMIKSSRVVGRVPLHYAARGTVSGIPMKAKVFWEHACREGIELKSLVKIFYMVAQTHRLCFASRRVSTCRSVKFWLLWKRLLKKGGTGFTQCIMFTPSLFPLHSEVKAALLKLSLQ